MTRITSILNVYISEFTSSNATELSIGFWYGLFQQIFFAFRAIVFINPIASLTRLMTLNAFVFVIHLCVSTRTCISAQKCPCRIWYGLYQKITLALKTILLISSIATITARMTQYTIISYSCMSIIASINTMELFRLIFKKLYC